MLTAFVLLCVFVCLCEPPSPFLFRSFPFSVSPALFVRVRVACGVFASVFRASTRVQKYLKISLPLCYGSAPLPTLPPLNLNLTPPPSDSPSVDCGQSPESGQRSRALCLWSVRCDERVRRIFFLLFSPPLP